MYWNKKWGDKNAFASNFLFLKDDLNFHKSDLEKWIKKVINFSTSVAKWTMQQQDVVAGALTYYLNPSPHMPILDSSNSAANKDMLL